ncbi:MAG: type restriction enzyme [Pseudomonadota bacterium]|nr:type restriction enzyme [Pseudomonadota bacterium]
MFPWVLSDFGLYDAIEAGLVKTPRVVVRDDALPDAKTYRSKLFHLYNDSEVKDNLNSKAQPHEPLPPLVQTAYTILSNDWKNTLEDWQRHGHTIPPVMLTVCNRIETARRIEHYFVQGDCHYPELHAPHRTLRVDSQVLTKAEGGETAKTDKAYEERLTSIIKAADIPATRKAELLNLKKEEQLRAIVDYIGKRGMAGQDMQKVISVAMLSEGWDAKNVTQIMGLRAFTSQMLCEQVIGRGLRRVAYEFDEDGLLLPEYVNIFGVPLPIFQDVSDIGIAPPPPKASTEITVREDRGTYAIRWPNLLRIETVIKPVLILDHAQIDDLELAPETTPLTAELAPMLGGETDLSKIQEIDLTQSARDFRLQREIFRAARKLYERIHGPHWTGNREYLVFQLVRIVEDFIASGKLLIPSLFHQEPIRRRILIAFNLDRIAEHLYRFIRLHNQERIEPIFDPDHPIGSTADLRPWSTTRPCHPTQKSHLSHTVFDSAWEAAEACALEHSPLVNAYAKNDHLGFHILYLFNGVSRKFFPDFLIRLSNGKTLILEVKGQDSQQNQIKRDYLNTWVKTINQHGGFGEWCWAVSREVTDIHDLLAKH